jgi:hypothetical protein
MRIRRTLSFDGGLQDLRLEVVQPNIDGAKICMSTARAIPALRAVVLILTTSSIVLAVDSACNCSGFRVICVGVKPTQVVHLTELVERNVLTSLFVSRINDIRALAIDGVDVWTDFRLKV